MHALNATSATPKAVLKNPKLAITQLEKRIDRLTAEALILIGKHPELKRILTLLIGIKGKRNRLDFKQSIYAALILQSPDSVIR